MFNRQKLVTKKGYKYQYGKSPVLQRTLKNTLRTNTPSSFHSPKKRLKFSSLSARIPSKLKRLTVLLGAVALVAYLVYLLAISSFFNVEIIKISTELTGQTELTGSENLSANIINDLESYKGKNLIFINKDEIIAKIQSAYPEIENINVGRDLPDTIVISFTEYPLVANITNISNETNKKFIINSIGYIVKEDMDDPNLPYVKIRTDAPLNTTSSIIELSRLNYILGAKSYFEEKFGMKIIEVEYKVIPREIHLRTEKYFYIWLDIQKPYEDQLKKLKKALVKLDIYNESLEYIDLRITGESGEKIIYKRR